MVSLLKNILKKLAQLAIWRYRPGVIGVTGSVGKTSTKLAIGAVVGAERKARVLYGNLNNELGLPLTVLGDWREEELRLVSRDTPPRKKLARKFIFWCKAVGMGICNVIFPRAWGYPEILVLEYGADRPGDMKRLLSIVRPNISVITAIGEVPVHVEFYSGPDEVAREKARLIEWLPTASFAVLNYDDEAVMNLKDRTRAHVMTFGFGKDADVRITSFENRVQDGNPAGISFKLEYGGSFVPVRIDGVFGRVQAYASAAAACIGLIFGMNLVKISEALRGYRPAPGRMELLPGVNSSFILNDSYNASPLSMHAALDTLKDLPAKRRVAVLGDMLEIGRYAMEAHERVGRLVAKVVKLLITVGPRAKFIADAAQKSGLQKKNILSFESAEEAAGALPELVQKGDLVLVKASHAMALEKIAEQLQTF